MPINLNNEEVKLVSDCCWSDWKLEGDTRSTHWGKCLKCLKPCTPISISNMSTIYADSKESVQESKKSGQDFKEQIMEDFGKLKIFSTPVPYGGNNVHTFVVDIQEVQDFISKTIDQTVEEVMKCVPKERTVQVEKLEAWILGWNDCREQLLFNLTSAGLLIKDNK